MMIGPHSQVRVKVQPSPVHKFLRKALAFYSFLIAVARNPNTMMNNSGQNGHAYHHFDLRGNAFSFSLLNMKLPVGLSYISFIIF